MAVDGPATTTAGSFSPSGDDPRIGLRLAQEAAWVADQYPMEKVDRHDDGSVDVRLAVTAVPWLQRLLLRLGPAAEVTAIDPPLDEALTAAAAARILARYGRPATAHG